MQIPVLSSSFSTCAHTQAAEPAAPPTKSAFRGTIFLLAYLCVGAFLALYLYTSSSSEYPYTTGIQSFPRDSCVEDDEVCEIVLPAMNCVVENGCFVKTMPTSKTYQQTCTYVAQGEAFPESLRFFYYVSDPVELMTILSIDGSTSNFAVGGASFFFLCIKIPESVLVPSSLVHFAKFMFMLIKLLCVHHHTHRRCRSTSRRSPSLPSRLKRRRLKLRSTFLLRRPCR